MVGMKGNPNFHTGHPITNRNHALLGAHHSTWLYIPIIWSPQMGALQGTKKTFGKGKSWYRVLRRDMLVPRFGKYSLMTICLKEKYNGMLERLNFNLLEITKTTFTTYHRSKDKLWHLKSQTYCVFFHDRPQNKEKRFHWHPSFGRSQAILLPHVRLICFTFWRKCSSQKNIYKLNKNVNRHLSVFQKSLDQKINRPKWKQSSGNIRGFQENRLGLLLKSTPIAFSHVPLIR